MRLGRIQKDVMKYLSEGGSYLMRGFDVRVGAFTGYDAIQVFDAADALVKRGILRKEGPLPRYIIVTKQKEEDDRLE